MVREGSHVCKNNFKDEIPCHTRIKIMSIIISFESTITPAIGILYTA